MSKQDPGSSYEFDSTDIAATGATADSPVIDHTVAPSCTFMARATAVGTSLDGALYHSPDNSTWTLDDGASGNDTSFTQLTAVGEGQINVPNPQARYSKVIHTAVGAVTGVSVSATGPLRHVVPS